MFFVLQFSTQHDCVDYARLMFQSSMTYVLTLFIVMFSIKSRFLSGDRAKVTFFNSLIARAVFDFLIPQCVRHTCGYGRMGPVSLTW